MSRGCQVEKCTAGLHFKPREPPKLPPREGVGKAAGSGERVAVDGAVPEVERVEVGLWEREGEVVGEGVGLGLVVRVGLREAVGEVERDSGRGDDGPKRRWRGNEHDVFGGVGGNRGRPDTFVWAHPPLGFTFSISCVVTWVNPTSRLLSRGKDCRWRLGSRSRRLWGRSCGWLWLSKRGWCWR